jgi:hypothetical protein
MRYFLNDHYGDYNFLSRLQPLVLIRDLRDLLVGIVVVAAAAATIVVVGASLIIFALTFSRSSGGRTCHL